MWRKELKHLVEPCGTIADALENCQRDSLVKKCVTGESFPLYTRRLRVSYRSAISLATSVSSDVAVGFRVKEERNGASGFRALEAVSVGLPCDFLARAV